MAAPTSPLTLTAAMALVTTPKHHMVQVSDEQALNSDSYNSAPTSVIDQKLRELLE